MLLFVYPEYLVIGITFYYAYNCTSLDFVTERDGINCLRNIDFSHNFFLSFLF